MDPTALRHAKARLQKVEEAVQSLQEADTFDGIESAWTDFLMNASTIYSKLEQGAKSNGKSNAWFGRIKTERKNDPLLSYLHHARNSDEHGIEETSHRKAVGYEWTFPDGQKSLLRFEHPDVLLSPTNEGEGNTPFSRIIRYTDVVRVHDRRFRDFFDPPDSHLGVALQTRNPAELAAIALPRLQAIVSEAESL